MGRALWACGCVVNSTLPKFMKMAAKDIFDKDLPWVWKSISPQILLFNHFGAHTILSTPIQDDKIKVSIEGLANRLVQNYQDEVKDDWQWFEFSLTYDNARLPQALFEAYTTLRETKILRSR